MSPTIGMTAYSDKCSDTISFSLGSIDYLWERRQQTSGDPESGGQLFGIINNYGVIVTTASGPYSNDMRSSTRYQSDPLQAQKEIEQQAKRGQLYLGEWHTHCQNLPNPSHYDITAMKALVASSSLNLHHAILLIVGNNHIPNSFYIESFGKTDSIKWNMIRLGQNETSAKRKNFTAEEI